MTYPIEVSLKVNEEVCLLQARVSIAGHDTFTVSEALLNHRSYAPHDLAAIAELLKTRLQAYVGRRLVP